jgi:hypothetical protein
VIFDKWVVRSIGTKQINMELTVAQEIVKNHLEFCNNVQQGFYELNKDEFEFKVGEIVHANSSPMNIIGIIFGYVYCPITEQPRAVLGVNCDVMVTGLRKADKLEKLAFNCFTKDFKHIESRMTCLL